MRLFRTMCEIYGPINESSWQELIAAGNDLLPQEQKLGNATRLNTLPSFSRS